MSKLKYSLMIGTASALSVVSSYANAGFQWVPYEEKQPAINAVVPDAPVEAKQASQDLPNWLVNKPAVEAPKPVVSENLIQGFGSDMPLEIAVQQLVPPVYKVTFAAGVDASKTVSWQGGKAWRQVLNEAVASAGLTVRENGNELVVEKVGMGEVVAAATVNPAPAAPVQVVNEPAKTGEAPINITTVAPVENAAPAEAVAINVEATATVAEEAKAVEQAQVTEQVQAKAWVVEPNRTLREVLQLWADEAGWKVVWNSNRDYQIESGAIFEGEFESAAGGLIRAFANANPPVVGTFYKNKTIVVDVRSVADLD